MRQFLMIKFVPTLPLLQLIKFSPPRHTHTHTHTHARAHTHTHTHTQTKIPTFIHTHTQHKRQTSHAYRQPTIKRQNLNSVTYTPFLLIRYTVTQNAFKVSQNWIWPTFELKYICKFTKYFRKSVQNRIMNTCLKLIIMVGFEVSLPEIHILSE